MYLRLGLTTSLTSAPAGSFSPVPTALPVLDQIQSRLIRNPESAFWRTWGPGSMGGMRSGASCPQVKNGSADPRRAERAIAAADRSGL